MQPWHLLFVCMNLCATDVEDFAAEGNTDLMKIQLWACRRALDCAAGLTALTSDGTPAACFGFTVERGDIGVAWLVRTERGHVYLKSMIPAFRKICDAGMFRVIEAQCRPARNRARAFLEHLGFRHVGDLPKHFSNGQAMALFTREPA